MVPVIPAELINKSFVPFSTRKILEAGVWFKSFQQSFTDACGGNLNV